MDIAVTGATGYVGAHTARALLAAGHRVRLLVPSAEAHAPVLGRLSAAGQVTVHVGDICCDADVVAFVDGADALVHAAGVVGTDERRVRLMWDVNAYATEAILHRAVERGLDPVLTVSSYSALWPPRDGVISPSTPTTEGRSAYAKTKAYADRVARNLQAACAPVVVTYPSSVVGPAFGTAPGVTERGWAPILRWAVAPRVRGGMQMIDVRDVADVHVRAMRPGRGPHRYVCGGELLSFDDMVDALSAGLGRRIRRVRLPAAALIAAARAADLLARHVALPDGLSYEAATLLLAATPTDDSETLRDLDMSWRPAREAIIASVRGSRTDARGQQLGDPAP
ncbi:NAD-dependent epimerase/dehydratase family protein [Mycobacterium sp. PSTR-4-N]|uniref:NAD-dependent epimerase/dehydratase family protein n=1 Tax=Mycobacterium sp. PSTR-4-N TaxID=2917745 RepID=UPI001F152B45|nr:NAD-dependent epimerase/dehydratase family protein [Mycobacterium sp. PSTR-4-N]MCG7592887.1 NAD-dependent epimerase/dehydratase family protein [Mycobacterium sp. PSTR-4-N]